MVLDGDSTFLPLPKAMGIEGLSSVDEVWVTKNDLAVALKALPVLPQPVYFAIGLSGREYELDSTKFRLFEREDI